MSKMVVFEVTTRVKKAEIKQLFIANYVQGDERLFQANLAEAQILTEDMLVSVGAFTTVKRHTDSGFIVKHFHAGDRLILTSKGDWKFRRSLEGYMAVFCKRLLLYRKDVCFWIRSLLKRNELGTINRECLYYLESH